jgi:hypothetical protein
LLLLPSNAAGPVSAWVAVLQQKQATPVDSVVVASPPPGGVAPLAVTFPVAVRGHSAVPRTADFRHSIHGTIECLTCHSAPVTLAPSAAVATCRDCHDDHHAADRACSACHVIANAKAGHPTPAVAHQRCDACHAGATVARLAPTRSLCATCHATQASNHFDRRECTTCHFLTEPGAYRPRLTTRPG